MLFSIVLIAVNRPEQRGLSFSLKILTFQEFPGGIYCVFVGGEWSAPFSN